MTADVQITPQQVMALRAATGLPMMKCKEALVAEHGDMQKAIERLRKEGLKTAESKAGRTTGDGIVRARVAPDGRSGAIVALLCETEPVSKTPIFVEFVNRLLTHVETHRPAGIEALLGQALDAPGVPRGTRVEEALKGLIAQVGENMKVAAAAVLAVDGPGVVSSYVHHDESIGALVAVSAANPTPELKEATRQLAMHVAYAKPTAMTRAEVPAAAVAAEREVARGQVAQDPKMKGKPTQILEKIIEGKVDAFYRGPVLGEQPWFSDNSKNVNQVLQAVGGKPQAFRLAQVTGS